MCGHPKEEQPVAILDKGKGQDSKLLVQLAGPNSAGEYRFQCRTVSLNGTVSPIQATFAFDKTFVNYFWADYDASNGRLYILSGDENSLFKLKYHHTASVCPRHCISSDRGATCLICAHSV